MQLVDINTMHLKVYWTKLYNNILKARLLYNSVKEGTPSFVPNMFIKHFNILIHFRNRNTSEC